MTKRSDEKKTPEKKARKLAVRKETVVDLAPRGSSGENIRGGKGMSDLCKSRDCQQ